MPVLVFSAWLVFFLCCTPFRSYAVPPPGAIAVTRVELRAGGAPSEKQADIVVNGAVAIRNVRFSRIGGRTEVRFPEYVSRKKRVYPQVRMLTREAADVIRSSLETGRCSPPGSPSILQCRISRFSMMRSRSNLKAIAAVTVNGAIEIECKVMGGKNGPWIAWPAHRSGSDGKWVPDVRITDKRAREEIEIALLDRYDAACSEENGGE
jgi:DNA-binding cell septation regulator SpoVG